MKKRIIALSAIAIGLFTLNAAAKTNESFNVYTSRTEKTIRKIEADIPDGYAAAVIYNADGTLFSSAPVKIKDKEGFTEIGYPDNNYTLNLYYNIGTDSFLQIKGDETKYFTENTSDKPNGKPADSDSKPSDGNNGQPSSKPSSGNNNSSSNMPSESAKIGSVAVVKESGTEYDSDSDRVIAYLDVLYNNKEIRIKLDEDFKIGDADDAYSYMIGKSVTELECGDILALNANLSGRLYGVKLLFRAPAADPVSADGDSSVFDLSDDGTMFGLIQNTLSSRFLILYDDSGKFTNAKDILIEPDTAVYIYDFSKKKNNLRVAAAADILKSYIPAADYDDNDNIIKWSEDCTHNYAFVRTYNDSVCNIVIYENYEIN